MSYELAEDRAADLPAYMVDMLRRSKPHDSVVEGSTPVVAFGDPQSASVATLGINPSLWEFYGRAADGPRILLQGSAQRLATLEALGLTTMANASPDHLREVVECCASYFDEGRNAYWRWFGVLQRLLGTATDDRFTYRDRGACHLDLVQWATDPVWGDKRLTQQVKADLLAEGVPHLRRQLEHHAGIRVVLLNGATVIEHVQAVGLAVLEAVGSVVYRPRDGAQTTLLVGQSRPATLGGLSRPVQFIGWSCNLQSSPGANAGAFVEGMLAPWLAERMDLPPAAVEPAA